MANKKALKNRAKREDTFSLTSTFALYIIGRTKWGEAGWGNLLTAYQVSCHLTNAGVVVGGGRGVGVHARPYPAIANLSFLETEYV